MAAGGFIAINTWQQGASLPFKPIKGRGLQVKMSSLMFFWRNDTTFTITIKYTTSSHRIGSNQKRSKQSLNADQYALETVFLIAICRQSSDKWQSKKLFLTIFDLRVSIVLTFSIFVYPVCLLIY